MVVVLPTHRHEFAGNIKVIHGPNDDILDLTGASVGDVRASLVHAFNVPPDAVALVNGVRVPRHYRLKGNSILEFVVQRGRKGVGDQVWTDEEFCKFFKITKETLQAWIAQGLKIKACLDDSLRITETAVDEFFRGRVIESPYLTAEQAASYLHTTIKGIYSLLERRKLHKLPGSRIVLFTRDLLDAYVQGGEA
jgi:hypothetical protein